MSPETLPDYPWREDRREAPDEFDLIARAKEGDEEAINDLFGLAIGEVYRFLFPRIGNVEEAEDLTQIVCLKAVEHFPQFEPQEGIEKPLSRWMLEIANQRLKNWYRDTGRRREREIPVESDFIFGQLAVARDENPESVVIRKEEEMRLYEAIRKLPPDYQDLLIFKYTIGLSNREIGEILGRTEGAVKSLYQRALVRLRRDLRG